MPTSVRLWAANYEAMRLSLARLRAASGLSYDTLADATGVSRMALINLEHGATRGSLETWHRIAQGLGVPLADLVARLDDPPRKPAAQTSNMKEAAKKTAAKKMADKKAADKVTAASTAASKGPASKKTAAKRPAAKSAKKEQPLKAAKKSPAKPRSTTARRATQRSAD